MLVHEKNNLPPGAGKTRPAACEYGLVERVVVATHVVGSNDFLSRKDRTNLGIKSIEDVRGERLRLMLVVKTLVGVCILRLPDLALIRRNPGVITVVRANDLNLIQLQRSVGGLSPDSRGIAGQNRGQGDGGRNAEAAQVQGNIL